MKLTAIASNMTELTNGKFVVLFSYNTPVASFNTDTGRWFQTNTHFSKTTSAHITKWYKHHGRDFRTPTYMVSQTEIEAMTM